MRGDTAYLERALAPTFLFTHGDGWVDGGAPLKVDTKASWIEDVKNKPAPYIYRELDHQQVELHGDVAITLGRYFYLPQSTTGNAAHMHVWFERVYAKRNGQWQQLSHRTVKGPVRDDAVKALSSSQFTVHSSAWRTLHAYSRCSYSRCPSLPARQPRSRGRHPPTISAVRRSGAPPTNGARATT